MISSKLLPYHQHPEAWIISCFFNPSRYSSRRKNCEVFYQQLQRSNVNYLIAECAFGGHEFELPDEKNILRFRPKNKIWHKERLLNLLVRQLPPSCRYVFWLDTDVLLTNKYWLVEGVEELQTKTLCQPFSIAVRLEKDKSESGFNVKASTILVDYPNPTSKQQLRIWRSFAYNYCKNRQLAEHPMFDVHGHTGFAWGARREILERVPLYDKAIVGTADHIIAHAGVGQIPHNCLEKAFRNRQILESIYDWSRAFNDVTQNKLGFVEGELWHLWHGDLKNRQYLQRTQDFSEMDLDLEDLIENDDGLYELPDGREDVQNWMNDYFESRDEDGNASGESTIVSSVSTETFEGFGGGGDFSGSGAGGSWENYS